MREVVGESRDTVSVNQVNKNKHYGTVVVNKYRGILCFNNTSQVWNILWKMHGAGCLFLDVEVSSVDNLQDLIEKLEIGDSQKVYEFESFDKLLIWWQG